MNEVLSLIILVIGDIRPSTSSHFTRSQSATPILLRETKAHTIVGDRHEWNHFKRQAQSYVRTGKSNWRRHRLPGGPLCSCLEFCCNRGCLAFLLGWSQNRGYYSCFAFRTENFTSFPEVVNLATERHSAACLEMVAANSMQNKRWKMPLAKKHSWN